MWNTVSFCLVNFSFQPIRRFLIFLGSDTKCITLRGQFPSTACHTFLNCWGGVATEQSCPDGLLFNTKGYCDYAENVNCAGRRLVGKILYTKWQWILWIILYKLSKRNWKHEVEKRITKNKEQHLHVSKKYFLLYTISTPIANLCKAVRPFEMFPTELVHISDLIIVSVKSRRRRASRNKR